MTDNNKKPKSPAPPVNAKRSPAVKPVVKPEPKPEGKTAEKPEPKPTEKPARSVYDEIAEKRRAEGRKASFELPADDVKVYSPASKQTDEDDVKIFNPKDKKKKPQDKKPVRIADDDDNFDVEVPPPKDKMRRFWILLIIALSALCAGTLLFYLYLNGAFDGFINML